MVNNVKRLLNALVPVLFIAAGIFLIVMGVKTTHYHKVYKETTATIANIYRVDEGDDYHYDVFVKYTVDGKSYDSELGSYSSDMREGQEVSILYDSADPLAIIPAGKGQVIYFFAAGVVCILLGAVAVIRVLRGGF